MSCKLIAVDLDETLLNKKKQVSERNANALRRATESGIKIVVATGRVFTGTERIYDALALGGVIMCCGGAQIYSEDKALLYQGGLSSEQAKAVMDFAQENSCYYQLYVGNDYWYKERTHNTELYQSFCGAWGQEVPDIYERAPECAKALLISEIDSIPELKKRAAEKFSELNALISYPTFLEFYNKNTTKGTGLEFIAKHYGIKQEEIIAFGDSELDIPMLKYAGVGVAVQNSLPSVLDIADHITLASYEDGVAEYIERYLGV